MVNKIDHVAIVVRDIDEATQAFIDLGLRVESDEYIDQIAVRLAYLLPEDADTSHSSVQLVQPTGQGEIQAFLDQNGQGLHHVCFAVVDIPEALSNLKGMEDTDIFMGGHGKLACFLDRRWSGATIEFTELSQRGAADALAVIEKSQRRPARSISEGDLA